MKKLSVLTPEQQLIEAKYQYPCTVITYKNGTPTSKRVVTHNIKDTIELQKLYPRLAAYINTYEDDDIIPKRKTVKELMNQLGK